MLAELPRLATDAGSRARSGVLRANTSMAASLATRRFRYCGRSVEERLVGSWERYRSAYLVPLAYVLGTGIRTGQPEYFNVYSAERTRFYDDEKSKAAVGKSWAPFSPPIAPVGSS